MKYLIYCGLVSIFLVTACSKNTQNNILDAAKDQALLDQYFAAATVGVISTSSDLTYVLKEPLSADISDEDLQKLITLTPEVPGKVSMNNKTLLTFSPEKSLAANSVYTVNIALKLLNSSLYDKDISYQIKTIEQDMKAEPEGMVINDDNSVTFLFGVKTADLADLEKLKSCFEGGSATVDITERKPMDYLLEFTYRDIKNKPKQINYKGTNIGSDTKGQLSLFDFNDQDLNIVYSYFKNDDKTYNIYFSQKLNRMQDLTGLVMVDKQNASYTVKNNILTIFLNDISDKNTVKLYLDKGITSTEGKSLTTDQYFDINIQTQRPEVQFVSDGNYFPSEGDFKIPIKTRGLEKIRLVVIEVKQENVAHYLAWQSLAYADFYNLRMYGKPVYDQIVPLNQGITDHEGWTVHGIDLTARLRKNPGSIYHISMEFAPEFTTLNCAKSFSKYKISNKIPNGDYFTVKDFYYEDYYGYYEDYNWQENNNPCKLAFYINSQPVQKLFICSDYSVITKKAGRNYHIALTKLMDLTQVSGADVTLYDLQAEKMATKQTSSDGFVSFENMKSDASVMKVEKGNQITYLALDPNESNTLTEFDIAGERTETDTEFFIYTERDVWRPGDSIYVDLMVNKADASLPEGLPVVMTFYNTDNIIVDEQVRNIDLSRQQIYSFKLHTPTNAKTGNYRCIFQIGPKSVRKNIRIETIKPNTTEAIYKFKDLVDKTIYSENISGSVQVKYLTGFEIANAKVHTVGKVRKIVQPFAEYKDYTFDVLDNDNTDNLIEILNAETNEKGFAQFTGNQNLKSFNTPMNVSIETETVIPGGGSGKEGKSVVVSPFETYLGAKRKDGSGWSTNYTFQDNIEVAIVSLNPKGKLNSQNTSVTYILQQNIDTWWVDKYRLRSAGNFVNADFWKDIPKANGTINITGKGKITYPKGKLGKGAYKLTMFDDKSGHKTQVYFTVYDGKESIPGSQPYIVDFQTDKDEYTVGENVSVMLPKIDGAKALLSLERGNKVLKQSWHTLSASANIVKIPSDESWTPNVYIHVTIVQPYKNENNDLPLRMYGIKHIKMAGGTSDLKPVTNIPDRLESNKTYTFTIGENSGKPMEYTLSFVDEGLLNLTGFATPDPVKHFSGKYPLLVKTWDIYKYLIAFFKGKFAGIITIGGDDAYNPDALAEVNRFKSFVNHQGPFKLAKNGKNTHTITIPNFVGKLRLMVVACNDRNFGHLEKYIPVKNPLMVQTQFPRTLNVTDKFILPVTVFRDDASVSSATLTTKGDANMIKGIGQNSVLSFDGKNQLSQAYNLEVLNKTGKVNFETSIKSGTKGMSESTEILINYPNSYETAFDKSIVDPGKKSEYNIKIKGYPEVFSSKFLISGIKIPNFTQYAADLIEYPYGCLEQTTSAGFSQLYLDKIISLDPAQNKERLENLRITLDKIARFQQSSGKYNYWDGNYYHFWSDIYAGNFLVEMKRLNQLPKNSEMLQKWINVHTTSANNWALAEASSEYVYESESIAHAFRLFVLAKGGSPAKSAMNRFVSSNKSKNPLTWWLLAGSFQLSGYESKAKEFMTIAELLQINNDNSRDYDTFGDEGRDLAIIVEVLSYLNVDKSKSEKYYDQMVNVLNKQSWVSTQTKGFAFIGAYKYFGKSLNVTNKVDYTITGLSGGTKTYNHSAFEPKVIVIDKSSMGKNLVIQNKGKGPIYIYNTQRYIDNNINKTSQANNLNLRSEFYNATQKQSANKGIRLGDDIIVRISVNNPSSLEVSNLALNLKMPSGWELINPRMYETSVSDPNENFTYQDFKDDRVYTFFDLKAGGLQVFTFKAKAAFIGDFYMPAVTCEHMYDGNIYARTETGRIKIAK